MSCLFIEQQEANISFNYIENVYDILELLPHLIEKKIHDPQFQLSVACHANKISKEQCAISHKVASDMLQLYKQNERLSKELAKHKKVEQIYKELLSQMKVHTYLLQDEIKKCESDINNLNDTTTHLRNSIWLIEDNVNKIIEKEVQKRKTVCDEHTNRAMKRYNEMIKQKNNLISIYRENEKIFKKSNIETITENKALKDNVSFHETNYKVLLSEMKYNDEIISEKEREDLKGQETKEKENNEKMFEWKKQIQKDYEERLQVLLNKYRDEENTLKIMHLKNMGSDDITQHLEKRLAQSLKNYKR